jgi:hypothetical protein
MRRRDLVRERDGRHFGHIVDRRARVLLVRWEGTRILQWLDENDLVLVESTPPMVDPYRARTVRSSPRAQLTEWLERTR